MQLTRHMKAGDLLPALCLQLGDAIDLSAVQSVKLFVRERATGTVVLNVAGAVASISDRVVKHDWVAGETDNLAGEYEWEFELRSATHSPLTVPDDRTGRLIVQEPLA